jgi:hypothetical protein
MDKLNILWVTDNKEAFLNMISMYSLHSVTRGWWKQVNIIIWGPSAILANDDPQVQNELLFMMSNGVTIEACKACSDYYELSDDLQNMGIVVKNMGETLTEYIKHGEKIISI